MSYDWEKIFQGKTNKELYEIMNGNSLLTNEAIPFAKKELENRNFDFNNIEANKTAWRLSKLLAEELYEKPSGGFMKFLYIFSKIYTYLLLTFLSFLLTIYTTIIFPDLETYPAILMILIFLFYITIFILLIIFFHHRRKKRIARRTAKINSLTEELGKQNLLNKDDPIMKDMIDRHSQSVRNKRLLVILGVPFAGTLIILRVVDILLALVR